jgi:hypothetical protein
VAQVVRVHGKKRLKAADLARFAAFYGLPAGAPVNYAQFVGLLLNTPLVTRLKALAVNAALGLEGERIGPDWADALGDTEEEGLAVIGSANFSRYLSRKRAGMQARGQHRG